MEDESGAPAPAVETPAPEAPAEAPADKGEGTTPEEVAEVLKGSGIKLDTPKAEAEPEAPAEEPAPEEPEEEEPEEPEPEPEPEAPTDGPDFTLQVVDANGVTFKLQPGDNLEDALKDFEPKSNGQILQILHDLQQKEGEKAKYEADQAAAEATNAQNQRVADIQKGWNEEIKALQGEKRLPATGTERVDQVYKFMAEENDKRIAAGAPTIGSFEDALDKLENKEAREAKVEADKAAKETARKNGSLVGGSSAPATGASPVYKAGSARNATQAAKAMGLL